MIDTRIDSIIYQSEIYCRDLVNSLTESKKVGKSLNSQWAKVSLILSFLSALDYDDRLTDNDDITNVNYILYQLIKLCELYQYPSASPLIFSNPPDIITFFPTGLLSGRILVGSSSNVATQVTPSGAVLVSTVGVFSMTSTAVTNGLNVGGGKIKFGGTLTEDTTIDGAFDLNIGEPSSSTIPNIALEATTTIGLLVAGNGIGISSSGIAQSATTFTGTQKFQNSSLWIESSGTAGVFAKLHVPNILGDRTISFPTLAADAEVLTSEAISNGLTVAANSLKLGGALTAGTSFTGSFGFTLSNSSTNFSLNVAPTVTWAGGGFTVGISPIGTISQTLVPSRTLLFGNISTISANNALHDIISVAPTIAIGVTTGSRVRGIFYNPTFTGAGSTTHYAAIFASGSVGIGTITPVAPLQVGATVTLPITPVNIASNYASSTTTGSTINSLFFTTQTVGTTGGPQSVEGYTKTTNSSGTVVLSLGTIGNTEHAGLGTVTTMRSVQAGGISTAGGTITEHISFYGGFAITAGAGVCTRHYGLFLATASAGGGTITSRFGVYQEDPLAENAFGGTTSLNGGFRTGISEPYIKIKILDIGDWNMDTTASVTVAHGIADFKKIRSIYVMIRNDADNSNSPLAINGASSGFVSAVTGANIQLNRDVAGPFDSAAYDSTSFNRGYITIWYEA